MGDRYALLIGVSEYSYMAPLQFAPSDARNVARRLIDDWDFPKKNVVVISDLEDANRQPTKAIIGHFLENYKSLQMKAEDVFLFLFSGHGVAKGKKDYLVPKECDPRRVQDDGIQFGRLVEELQQTGSRNIFMFIDACRNEPAKDRSKGLEEADYMGVETPTLLLGKDPTIAAFFSCQPQKRSFEIDDKKAGAFTYALCEAMNEQSSVQTIKELKNHLEARVPTLTEEVGGQKPILITTKDRDDGQTVFDYPLFARGLSERNKRLLDELRMLWGDETAELRQDKEGGTVYAAALELLHKRRARLGSELGAALDLLELFCKQDVAYDDFKRTFLTYYTIGRVVKQPQFSPKRETREVGNR